MASIRDKDWIKQIFVMTENSLDAVDRNKQFWSSVTTKFTDSSLGGNLELNPVPQFTSNADLKTKSRYARSHGMGRYYSEAIDDNSERIYMRFGVPSYTSLTNFFTSYYDMEQGALARTGRTPGLVYSLAYGVAYTVTIPFQGIIWCMQRLRWAVGMGSGSSWYRLKPTMPLFWGSFNDILNYIGIFKGITIPGDSETDTIAMNKHLSEMMPAVFKEDGRIDIYAVANRAQRMANKQIELLEEAAKGAQSLDEVKDSVKRIMTSNIADPSPSATIDRAVERYMSMNSNTYDPDATDEPESSEENASWMDEFLEALNSERREGSDYICLRVNKTGEMSESFSNSTKTSPIQEKINGASSSAQASKFSFAGGNLGDGLIAGTIETIIGGFKDVIAGGADAFGMSGLAVLGGAGFADIQDMYDSSSADFPSMSYSIDLRHPYAGNKFVQQLYFMPTICALLTAALPRSTGKSSYTSPFLLELFHPGSNVIRTGIIDSLSISRNVGNLGKNQKKDSLGYRIDFSIKDMANIMHVPLQADDNVLNSESKLNDYMGILANMDLSKFIYRSKQISTAWKRTQYEWKDDFTPAAMANMVMDNWAGDIVKALSRGTSRL